MKNPKPMYLRQSLAYFGSFGLLLYFATHYGVPFLIRTFSFHPYLSWFLMGGIFVMIPLFVLAVYLYLKENSEASFSDFMARYRFRKLNKMDLVWTVAALLFCILAAGLIFVVLTQFLDGFSMSPSFMDSNSLSNHNWWIYLAWLPFFFFNIMGEECMWRGYIMPRQELVYGRWTWLVHGSFWLLFHIPFGFQLMITVAPVIYVESYVVQKRRNTWTGVLIHGVFNALGFLSVSQGLV
jgi:membrane protease YdiL (CAAX protease family)